MTTNLNRVNEVSHPNPAKKDCIITLKDGFVFGNGKRQKAFSNINEAYEAVSKSKQEEGSKIHFADVLHKVPELCSGEVKLGDPIVLDSVESISDVANHNLASSEAIESTISAPPKPKAKRKAKAKVKK